MQVQRPDRGLPLRTVLVLPFVLQVVGAVTLVAYLSFKNGQAAVNDLSNRLMDKSVRLISKHLDIYLQTAENVNQINLDAINLGLIDLKDLETTGNYFSKQLKLYPSLTYIGYALQNGEFSGAGRYLPEYEITIDEVSAKTNWKDYTYTTNDQGNRNKIVKIESYQPLTETWYTETKEKGKTIWGKVYNWDDMPDHISATINSPIYDNNNQFIGVIGIDILLSDISIFLRQLNISPNAKTFIVERNGELIASSSTEQPFILDKGVAKRLSAFKSSDSQIQHTAKYLQQRFGNLTKVQERYRLEIQLNNQKQFLSIMPWNDNLGLDWLVITIIPESDFMAQIRKNNHISILLSFLTMIVAIGVGYVTSRWITQPILNLSHASLAITSGNFNHTVEARGIIELRILSDTFNVMAKKLQTSFADLARINQELDQTNNELEKRVEERTTELKRAKEVAEVASLAKSEFLANMSHELRTPLNAILGFAHLMSRESDLTSQQKEQLEIINRSGEHLLTLINEVLDLAKIESGKATLNENAFDFYNLLDEIKEMLVLRAASKGLHLVVERNANLPRYINTDEKKLRQVLINLLGNAIKFTEAGHIVLRVNTSEKATKDFSSYGHPILRSQNDLKVHPSGAQTLIFEVEDTGVGIAEKEINSIYETFIQTSSGRASQQGTGLGLAISKKFIELMGGNISVNSKVGQGTIFQFTIQILECTAHDIQVKEAASKVISLAPNQPQYRILVVDDRWENRQLLSRILKPIGFQVKEAGNGQEAVDLWKEWHPDLIWMDMRMPIMNGYQATQCIKADSQGQAITIIALTASALEDERVALLAAGCDDVVCKPFSKDTIFEKISQHLGAIYIYENQDQKTLSKPESIPKLSCEALSIMPKDWLQKLSESAALANHSLISQLLLEIPEEHHDLAVALQRHVDEFNFDQIMKLTQTAA